MSASSKWLRQIDTERHRSVRAQSQICRLSVKQFWCIASVLDPRYKKLAAPGTRQKPEASKQNSVINVITTTRLSSLTINNKQR